MPEIGHDQTGVDAVGRVSKTGLAAAFDPARGGVGVSPGSQSAPREARLQSGVAGGLRAGRCRRRFLSGAVAVGVTLKADCIRIRSVGQDDT